MMNNIKYLFLISIISIISVKPVLSFELNSDHPMSNFDIIDSLFQKYSENFYKNQLFRKGIKVRINITNHPSKWLLNNKIIRLLAKDSTVIYNDSISKVDINYDININNVSVKYYNDSLNSDSLNRFIDVKITGLKNIDGKTEYLEEFNSTVKDKISRKDLESVDSKQYDFASSPVPPEERTFIEDIIQPVILITSTIVAVILLFTVRSN